MKKLHFIYFDAGGGHRSAANALRQVVEQQGRPWEVRLVHLQEILRPLDIFRKATTLSLEDLYNLMLKKGWTLGSAQLMPGMHAVIRLYHPAQVRLLREFWSESRPDMVVSLVPNFNRALCQALAAALPACPFVTVLTDLADYPPRFWLEPQRQYVICGTDRAVEQARSMGIPREMIFMTSGMILNPRFYEPLEIDRRQERRALGLDSTLPTGLVMFGGEGSAVMTKIVERLERSGLKLQLIAICGHNQRLAGRLRGPHNIPLHVEGFTKRVPYFMHLSDFFIGKPGPGSISEALAMHLPVIVERNAWTLPQERYNTEWITEKGVGIVLPNFRDIAGAVERLLQPEAYQRFRAATVALKNCAVYEIPDILAKILGSAGG